MPKPTLSIPDDFQMYASVEGNLKLRKRFGVGGETIERWRSSIGARYSRPITAKKLTLAATKRIRAKFRTWDGRGQESIEDLDDYDISVCLRTKPWELD